LPLQDRRTYLQATPIFDYKTRDFSDWLKRNALNRKREENEIDFARRVYSQIMKQYKYERGPLGAASQTAQKETGDCDMLSVLFVAALRANDVSARVLFGRPAKSKTPDEDGKMAGHARAEFFANGVGWVPVDPAYGLSDTKTKGMRHFGHDDGTFLVMHVDPEFVVTTLGGQVRYVHSFTSVWFSTVGKGPSDTRNHPVEWRVNTVARRE
jgi:hypothetical protein